MAQILDYSAGYPAPTEIARRGFVGAIRYLRKEGTSSVRPLTLTEARALFAALLTLALIYQHVSKSRVLEGRAAGRHDADWALVRSRECGVEPRAIYFAVDFDTISAAQWAAVREYMLGAAEVVGLARVGCYGEFDLLDYLFARESITWGWQTYAWSTGHNKDNQPRHPRAHLFQRLGQITVGGISCDVNDVLAKNGDYGQHPSPTEEPVSFLDESPDGINHGEVLARRVEPLVTGQDKTGGPLSQEVWIVRKVNEIAADLAELKARQVADVDEAALAAELAARGVNGVTAEQVKGALREVLSQTRLSAPNTGIETR